MVRFEELQQLWQNQPQPESPAVETELRGMAAALRRFRRRQDVINGIKLGAMVWVVWFALWPVGISVVTGLGEALLLAGFITAIVTDWRIQSAIARLDFSRPSLEFVDATLERLRDPNARFRRNGWLSMALIAAGMNLMFAGASATQTVSSRITSHAVATLLPFVAFAFGLKVRAKRYAMEYKPLVERLAAIQAALKEHAQ